MAARRHHVGSERALAPRSPSGFECVPEGASHRLRLWGSLPPEWAGNLALHAYVAGIQLATGAAHRTTSGAWRATFLLRSRDAEERMNFDFLNMARRGPRLVPELPEPVVRISMRALHEEHGRLQARVVGKDSIGLLAEVLRRFSDFGLRPHRFVLKTHEGAIDDVFWLERVGAPVIPLASLEAG